MNYSRSAHVCIFIPLQLYPAAQDVVLTSISTIAWEALHPVNRTGAMQDSESGLPRIPVRETVWKLRIGSILRSHEPAKRGAGHSFGRLALPKNVRSNPFSYFPDSL